MNWDLFLHLLGIFVFSYWVFYTNTDAIANILRVCRLVTGSSRLEDVEWCFVALWRFVRPARKPMWFLLVIVIVLKNENNIWYWIVCGYTFLTAFILSDTYGDDPRDKKPSKIASLVKSLGHRLVVIPNGNY